MRHIFQEHELQLVTPFWVTDQTVVTPYILGTDLATLFWQSSAKKGFSEVLWKLNKELRPLTQALSQNLRRTHGFIQQRRLASQSLEVSFFSKGRCEISVIIDAWEEGLRVEGVKNWMLPATHEGTLAAALEHGYSDDAYAVIKKNSIMIDPLCTRRKKPQR